MSKILECSSRGDKRFSALYAQVNINGVVDTIESHYQLSKRFGDAPAPTHWKQCKGRKPTHMVFNGKTLPITYLTRYYNWLWKEYLDQNPSLVEYLKQFDGYNDCFARKGCNNQAEAISTYMKEKR